MGLPTSADLAQMIQITLAGVLAGAIGWQRHHVGRPAGLRTHALVSMAAALFTIAGISGFAQSPNHDEVRIAAQVVTGIGFLGAGTIFRTRDQVYGLTTAATLWLAAALGVAIAAGVIWVSIFATVLALVVLTVLKVFENGD